MTQIGYLTPNNVPIELIEARGIVPKEIIGTPDAAPTVGDEYMESFFDGHIRSIFDQAVTGQLSELDLLIIPRTSEGYLQLFYYLEEARRWVPEGVIPKLHLFDVLQTPAYATSEYVYSRVQVLDDALTAVTSVAIDADDLADAIQVRNEWRRTVATASSRRRGAHPTLVGGSFLRALRQSGQFASAEAANRLSALQDETTPDDTRFRLLVKGSPHDDTAVYDALESAGFRVVADDHFTGERVASAPVQEHPKGPWWALAEHYQREEISLRSFPQSRQDDALIDLAARAEVDGVLFIWEENDDTLGWDYPEQRRRLDAAGIPHVVVRNISYFTPDLKAIITAASALHRRSALETRTA